MKRKLSVILLIVVAAGAMLAFSACSYEDLHGTYIDADSTMQLVLREDDAEFGSLDTYKSYFVKYYDGGKKVGISTDGWKCYWKDFDFEFTVNDDDTITYVGYIQYDPSISDSLTGIERDADGKPILNENGDYIYKHILVKQ